MDSVGERQAAVVGALLSAGPGFAIASAQLAAELARVTAAEPVEGLVRSPPLDREAVRHLEQQLFVVPVQLQRGVAHLVY